MNTRLILHSVRALARYPLRSGFIMLSSLIGAAALTFVLSVGQGARAKMLSTVRQIFGDSSILVITGGHQLMGGPRPGAARLTLDDIDAVARGVPDVVAWDPQQVLYASVRRGAAASTVRVLGASERAEQVWSRRVTRGVHFDAAAVKRSDRVALVGETVIRDVFNNQDPIGAEIQIESAPFTVVGVLERFGTDLHGMDRDNEVVIPITTFMRRLANVDTILAAKLLVKDGTHVASTAKDVTQQLRARHGLAAGQPDDFNLLTPIEVQRMMAMMRRVVSLYLPLAASVVLLVGGLVAATLMLGAVNARVAEIGLRRAVGAQPRDISRQFLIETTVTVLGGGVAGIVLGLVVGQIVADHLKLESPFPWLAIALGLLLSTATGLLAGVLPARRAARLLPADALR
ncbi:ABC transporter permease [Opitutus terrae]|uniref:ABC3 transporter permease protein domain-containing protein n=1 Tax=Opitutus terrae (strain DSM 11246 / JCM 15787 / PB90-1) TaxID=452637 RepID=B1ZQD0_OPITP|nr:ABC transporter permease [Opitutus terrae]ACB73610.1 protein of unknown function DUF214 [Opitutus terrae PB90-1]